MKGEGFQLDHVAIGVPSIAAGAGFLRDELGGEPFDGGPGMGFRWEQFLFAGGGVIELLEPAGEPGGFLHRFLERRGAGVHHVTFEVPGLDGVCSRAEDLGFPVVERDDSDPEWKEAFLHPRGAQSIVVQLVERAGRATVVPESRVDDPRDGDPEPGSVGIELIGLRLAVRDLDRARRLWCGLLGGVGRAIGGDLEVRWPGSVMRLLVRRVEGAVEEGPLAIEIACLRPAVVPRGRHPILGTVFEPVDITELPPPPAEDEAVVAIEDSVADGADAGETYFLDGDALAEEETP